MDGDHSISPPGVSRRTFLTVGAAAGGGMLLGFSLPALARNAQLADADASVFAPNAFLRIGADGRIALIIPYVEMGQGTYTSIPMLIAEELEVDLAQVRVEPAPADDALYANPLLGEQVTGGSTSIRAGWEPMRRAGAAARTMLIAAAAATWKVDTASCHAAKGEVIHGATGRKLSYAALAAKAATLTVPDQVALKAPKDFKLIGTSPTRLDTPNKVDGKAQFGIDVRLPGMLIATVAACPVFGGKLARVDDSKARAVNGVRQIVRLDDAVAVVADHMGAARKGLAALEIAWDEGANAHESTADIVARMVEAGKYPGVVARKEGDVETAMKSAATTVEAEYHLPFLAHATMEPMNCTVHIRKDACDIWVGSQVAARARAAAAKLTGLPPESVQVHNQLLGGGFGRRLEVDYVIQAVEIAKQVSAPVKVVWSREEDTQHDAYRPAYYDRLRAGLDRSGMPVSWHHRVVGSSILARWRPDAFKDGMDSDAVEAAAGPYGFPNLLIDYVREEPPAGMATGWWRGVGVTHNAFMVEGFVDELAHKAGRDPVEYRRALLAKAPRARAVLDLAAAKAGWGKPLAAGRGRGIAVLFGFGSYVAQVAEVTVAKDGQVRVERVVCAIDCGRTVDPDTVRAQMQGGLVYGLTAALYGEITVKAGRVEQANFDTYQALRIDEAPAIEVHLVDSTEAPGGVGEPGTSAIGPAVVNAIFAATGRRLRKLPVDTAQLKSA
jgi:isoquinoline 1-oxidoreductase beta subunit